MSKQFTAAGTWKLEMQGKLTTDDKITKYFPGVPADKSGVTIHQLLRHIAGLPSVVGGDYDKLWHPAGMETTGYSRPAFDEDLIATGYKEDAEWGKPTQKEWGGDAPYWHLKGNGGVLSTTEDMYKWHLALL